MPILHEYGHGFSYADICHQNNSWTNKVIIKTNQIQPQSTLSSGKSIHVAIDNSDGKPQTITESKTTLHKWCRISTTHQQSYRNNVDTKYRKN